MRVLGQFIFLFVGVLCADEQNDVSTLLDKAIKAHGGQDNLRKYPAVLLRGTGKLYTRGEEVAFNGAWAVQGRSQACFTMEYKIKNIQFKAVTVTNGSEAWFSLNDVLLEVTKDDLTARKDALYAEWVTRLFPLKEKDQSFKVARLGELKIGDKPAVGINVSKKGHRDIHLFFDKSSGLLLKSACRVKDARVSDQEFLQENYYHDYKVVRGNRYASKLLAHKDGKLLMEIVLMEIQPKEKLDQGLFSKP
jgi:hypothetical protein